MEVSDFRFSNLDFGFLKDNLFLISCLQKIRKGCIFCVKQHFATCFTNFKVLILAVGKSFFIVTRSKLSLSCELSIVFLFA